MSFLIGKWGIQEGIHNLKGKSRTYHTAAKCQDIGIIVKSCSLSSKTVGAHCCTNAFDLICGNRDTDTGSTYQNSKVTFSIQNTMCYLLGINRIIG